MVPESYDDHAIKQAAVIPPLATQIETSEEAWLPADACGQPKQIATLKSLAQAPTDDALAALSEAIKARSSWAAWRHTPALTG